MLSIPWKLYGRIIIQSVINETDGMMGEGQCSFQRGRGCGEQIFILRQLREMCESGRVTLPLLCGFKEGI